MSIREQTARAELRTRREDFIVFGAPLIGEEEIAEVVDTPRSGWPSTGPKAKRVERAINIGLAITLALALVGG